MDDASKIETYKAGLRLLYANDVAGLKKIVLDLMATFEGATDEVAITSHNFVDGGSAGQLDFSRHAKLAAALAVLAELDSTAAATLAGPGRVRFADFSTMSLQT